MYTNFHCCHSLGCLVTYRNSSLWPEGTFQCETESKGLTNFLVGRCTSCHRNLQLCKISSSDLVWLLSYACLIKEEEEEECRKLHLVI